LWGTNEQAFLSAVNNDLTELEEDESENWGWNGVNEKYGESKNP